MGSVCGMIYAKIYILYEYKHDIYNVRNTCYKMLLNLADKVQFPNVKIVTIQVISNIIHINSSNKGPKALGQSGKVIPVGFYSIKPN